MKIAVRPHLDDPFADPPVSIYSWSSDRHIYWNNCSFRTLMAPIYYINYDTVSSMDRLGASQQFNKYFLTDCLVAFDNTNGPSLK